MGDRRTSIAKFPTEESYLYEILAAVEEDYLPLFLYTMVRFYNQVAKQARSESQLHQQKWIPRKNDGAIETGWAGAQEGAFDKFRAMLQRFE